MVASRPYRVPRALPVDGLPTPSRPGPAPIARTLELFIPAGEVVEIRAVGVCTRDYRRSHVESGFFLDLMAAAEAAADLSRCSESIYFTPNRLKPELYARRADRITPVGEGASVGDNHITHYRWLLIDCDPVRLSHISATDEERRAAKERARAVWDFLLQIGWPEPAVASSGNGWHLLARLADLDNNEANRSLIRRVQSGLASHFDDDQVKIDRETCNPARCCKLYGTLARKGDDVESRPHRLSRLTHYPSPLLPASLTDLMTVAELLDEEEE